MARVSIQSAEPRELEKWDAFVADSENGTLFHQRAFLAYHGDKFAGREHFLSVRKGDETIGLLSLATAAEEPATARSPYGASVGAIVFKQQPSYAQSCEIVTALLAWLSENAITTLTLTPPTWIYHQAPSDTFAFALLEHGFRSTNRDICNVVRLDGATPVTQAMSANARNMARKAQKSGVTIVHHADIALFWSILEDTYRQHGTNPTHTQQELLWLTQQFADAITLHVALYQGIAVAGLCEFVLNARVTSSFYLCQKQEYEQVQGLSLLVYDAMVRAQEAGFAFYDFGTSSVGMKARAGVFRFKESYNAAGVFRETFEWRA